MSKNYSPMNNQIQVNLLNGNHFGWIGLTNREWLSAKSKDSLVYIGRAHKAKKLKASPLENPFKEKEFGRDGCIQRFRKPLWEDVKAYQQDKSKISNRLAAALKLAEIVKSGSPVSLVCFCVPEPCHGEVIRSFISWAIDSGLV